MSPKFICCLLFPALPFGGLAQNQAPVLQNLSAEIDWTSQTLIVHFDATDAENDPLDISIGLSNDGGKTYTLTASVAATGDIGYPVTPGVGRSIQCNVSALANMPGNFTLRVVADDRQPFDLQALVNEVDSNRLRADLTFVEGIRHRTAGLPQLQAVRDSMSRLFEEKGLHAGFHTFSYSGGYTGYNVIGTAPGVLSADSVVIVDAHYDTVINAPGADDNGSGTVGVMELARLLSRYPSKKTLRFIGFDLEEAGLVGSGRYVSTGIPATEKVAGVFNFEMIGYYSDEPNSQNVPAGFNLLFPTAYNQLAANQFRGNTIINVGVSTYSALHTLFSNSAATYVPDLKVLNVLMNASAPVNDLLRSDHASFWYSNKPALMLTDGAEYRNKCYHTPSDTLDEKLDFTFMANVVKATLAAAAQLAGLQHGDWASVSFAGSVGVQAPQRLLPGLSVVQNPAPNGDIAVAFANCPARHLSFTLFDPQGTAVYAEQLDNPPARGTHVLNTPILPGGIYFLTIQAEEGAQTFKVALY